MKLNKTFDKIPYNILQNIPFRCVTVVPNFVGPWPPPPPKNLRSVNPHVYFLPIPQSSCYFTSNSSLYKGKELLLTIHILQNMWINSPPKITFFIKERLFVASTELSPKYTGTHNHIIIHFQRTPWNIYLLHLKWVWQTTVWEVCISGTFWKPVQM